MWKIIPPFFKQFQLFIGFAMKHIAYYNQLLRLKIL